MNFIPWWKVSLGQKEAKRAEASIIKGSIVQGEVTKELERRLAEFLDVPYVVLATNGSAALLMALIVLGIKAGDEVIIPDLTFVATAQAPLLLGVKVKLVDVDSKQGLISPNKIEEAITPKTKAIIPVHLNGRAADIEKINRLAAKYNLNVIEDAVQAFGSKNSAGYLGTQSNVGIFSLGVTKLVTAVQGGFLATKSKRIFEKLKKIRNHGLSSDSSSFQSFNTLGFNFKFNDLLAGIGLSQLAKVEQKIQSLKDIYNFYKKNTKSLDYLEIIRVNIDNGEIPLWVEAICQERSRLIRILADESIQAKAFPPALSQLPFLYGKENFKCSRFYANFGLILPCGPDQPQKNLKRVVKVLNKKATKEAFKV